MHVHPLPYSDCTTPSPLENPSLEERVLTYPNSINSITILALSIRALKREKRGIVAAPDDQYPVRTINLGVWKPRRQNYMPKDSDGPQAMSKSSQSISLDSLKGYEGRIEAGPGR